MLGCPWRGEHARHVSPRFDSDSCLSSIRGWIQECPSNHFTCDSRLSRLSRLTPRLPKRGIDVGQKDDNSGIRLWPSEHQEGAYIALSHCWGSSRHLLTERHSISQREENIPWSELPKTFRDAICITRSLGLRYFWIDSLCIVRDDLSDWETESKRIAIPEQPCNLGNSHHQ